MRHACRLVMHQSGLCQNPRRLSKAAHVPDRTAPDVGAIWSGGAYCLTCMEESRVEGVLQ